jgi:hypothetical protein
VHPRLAARSEYDDALAALARDGARLATASPWDRQARLRSLSGIPEVNLLQITCAWLPDQALEDVLADCPITIEEPICDEPQHLPLPKWIGAQAAGKWQRPG